MTDASYDELRGVLHLAYERCAKGKGRTHSNSESFKNDDFWTLMGAMHESPTLREAPELAMPIGQALKDILEYLKSGSAIKLMDSVVYLSLAYMVDARTRSQQSYTDSVAQKAEPPAANPEDTGSTPVAVSIPIAVSSSGASLGAFADLGLVGDFGYGLR